VNGSELKGLLQKDRVLSGYKIISRAGYSSKYPISAVSPGK